MCDTDTKRKRLQKLQANFGAIKESGYILQSYGRQLAEAGAKGEELVSFLQGEAEKYERMQEDYPEIGPALDRQSEWLDAGLGTSDDVVKTLTAAGSMVEGVIRVAVSSLATATGSGTSLVTRVFEAQANHPEVDFQQAYGLAPVAPLLDTVDTAELDTLLQDFDPSLARARRGAWDSFYSSSEARLEQASHLMREVLSKVVSEFASNDEVKQAEWWGEAHDTEDGVSTRQRLRYLMYGPHDSGSSMPELDVVNSETQRYMCSRGLLLSIAHLRPIDSEKAVELALRDIERLLLIILERRRITGL